jgi:transcription initiation factor IIE alpha subunit
MEETKAERIQRWEDNKTKTLKESLTLERKDKTIKELKSRIDHLEQTRYIICKNANTCKSFKYNLKYGIFDALGGCDGCDERIRI